MKNQFWFGTISLMLVAIVLVLIGCGGGDPAPVTEKERVTKVLTLGAWKLKSVTVDGADETSTYSGLTLSFSTGSFTATNGGAVWGSSGTWTFTGNDASSFTRADGVVVSITEATDTSLKLKLSWSETTLGGGRVISVSGQHVFSMGK